MRKENSKYVERDGPIRDNEKCSMTCAEYAEGGASLNFYFDGEDCECIDPGQSNPNFGPQRGPYANLGMCCNKHPGAVGCDQCPSGAGALCPPGQNYPTVSGPFGPVRCCMGADAQSCGDDNGDALCGLYHDVARTKSCMTDEVNTSKDKSRPNMTPIKVCPKDVPAGFWQNGQNALPSCTGAPSPSPSPSPSIRNRCKSDSDCDTGYRCHKNRCKQDQSSPVTGQGSNKGGMSGGEIAGIVVGSIAGAILLLLAVGALLRGSGKKGKKK